MRRSYRAQRFLAILDRVREAMPEAAITTDIIVGFPGETEDDFQATLDVVERAQFAGAYTFQYSPRPGTPAADYADQVPRDVVQERYERLVQSVEAIAWEQNKRLIGHDVEVLVSVGEGRKDHATARRSGRAADGRLVHFLDDCTPELSPRPGDLVTTRITYAAPHHLVADAGVLAVERTPGGDAHASTSQEQVAGVMLGLPTVRST
jgi:tRNA-2-methylthio-N6-dimethylallyladenosine synthase